MSTDLFDPKAQELFHSLVDLSSEERRRQLDSACADDALLRRRVEQLLAMEAAVPEKFLAEGAGGFVGPALDLASIPGFQIIERLGEGGMGTVYLARQSSPERDVALKIVRTERLSIDALRRFQFEIDVLGQLQHPGIARIYQSGSTDAVGLGGEHISVPYFIMELVRGEPLLDYIRRHSLGVPERLRLFLLVCDAVDHAHQRGVIHRDLKSENILVSDSETSLQSQSKNNEPALHAGLARLGQPKILDFGIAKSLAREGDENVPHTRTGDLIGTLSNMSPEQLTGDERRIDSRVDVYALGVVLYQVLSGRLPLALSGIPMHEALRKIREEAPESLTRLNPEYRGDLVTIVHKALEKDPERRYRSAFDLASDIRKHLKGAPIEARSDSTWYVMRCQFVRHRALVCASVLFIILVFSFALTATFQADENRRLAESERATRLQAELALARSDIERGRLLGRADNPAGERLLWRSFLGRPASQQALWALGEYYSEHPIRASRFVAPTKLWKLTYTPDGSALLAATKAGSVLFLDPISLQETSRLAVRERDSGIPGEIQTIEVNSSGTLLATGLNDGSVHLWELASRQMRFLLQGHQDWIRDVSFSPDGTLLVSTSEDGEVRLWDVASGTLIRVLEHNDGSAWVAEFSHDGQRLACAGKQMLSLWDVPFDGQPLELTGSNSTTVSLAFAPDDKRLWAGGNSGILEEWDLVSGDCASFQPNNGTLRRLWMSPTGESLLVAGWYRVDQLDTRNAERLGSLPLSDFTWGLASSPQGDTTVIGDNSGLLRKWTPETPSSKILSCSAEKPSVSLSRDGRVLLEQGEGQLEWHDLTNGQVQPFAAKPVDQLNNLTVSTQSKYVAYTLGSSRVVELVDPKSGSVMQRLPKASNYTPRSVAFSPAEDQIAIAGETQIHLVELPSGSTRELEREGSDPISVAYSNDGRLLATVDRKRTDIVLHRVPSGKPLARLHHEGDRPWTVEFSEDGGLLFAGTWERVLQVWDLSDYTLQARLEGHQGVVRDVTTLPGLGGVIASCSDDQTVRLWDPKEGLNIATFTLSELALPTQLASIDGKRIVVCGKGSKVEILDLEVCLRFVQGNLAAAIERYSSDLASQVDAIAASSVVERLLE